MIDPGFWFMLPVGVVIATIAMMTGIGGAILFTPFFMLVLGLEPLQALAAGLLIEVFGFSSGVIGYVRKRSVDYSLYRRLVILTVPATILGVAIGRYISALFLKILLSLLLGYLAYGFLRKKKKCLPKHPECTGVDIGEKPDHPSGSIKAACFAGGLLVGMISSGLGEINEFTFLEKMRMKVALASGTSVLLVASSAIIGVAAHLVLFISAGELSVLGEILSIIVFTVPGVIIGAQIGVRLSSKVKVGSMERFVGALFLVLGFLVVLTII